MVDWIFRLEGLGLLEELGRELLPLGTLLSCRAAPSQPPFTEVEPFWRAAFAALSLYMGCLLSQMSSGSSHMNSSSLSPVKGRITLRAAVLPDSRGGTQTLQMWQHKKSETQLITEIAVWLNILFLHIHCHAKSLPLALSSFIKCFPKEIFLIIQINIHWSGVKNFKGLDACY